LPFKVDTGDPDVVLLYLIRGLDHLTIEVVQ